MANDALSYFKKAKRQKIPLKIGVSGPSGSGKTYSSLLLAKGLTSDLSKVAVLDTEDSAALYSDLGDFSVLNINKPFTPQKFIKAIELANQAGFEAIIIDSASHEWEGPGGCLEIHANLGGKFQDWAQVTPLHNNFLQAIKESKAHVICCMRKKTDYSMTNDGGRTKIEKVGLKEVQREGADYEMTIFFDVNIKHYASTSKDRTSLFMDAPPFIINEETGKTLKQWSNQGE